MKSFTNKLILSAVAALLVSTTAFADNASEISELKRQIQMLMKKTKELETKSITQEKKSKILEEQSQALIDETSNLKTGFNYTKVDNTKVFSGLGAAASKVYYSKSPLSIGGYGEMFYSYNSIDGDTDNSSTVDIKRFITYIGYKFSDDIILNTEIEYESAGVDASGNGDKVAVEFLYLDFLMNENANLRVGNFLMPMGLINQRHEPTLFNTVQRPDTSYYLIPSTWTESGLMVFGKITDDLEYKIAGVTGLVDSNAGEKWLRKGRGGSFTNNNPSLGGVARLDYTGINGLLLGASLYYDSNINIWDTHVDYKVGGFRAYGVYTQSSRDNSSADTAGTSESTDAKGGYLNLSYDVLSLTSSKYQLPLFVQYESITPEDKLNNGTSEKVSKTTTFGLNFVIMLDDLQQIYNFRTDELHAY